MNLQLIYKTIEGFEGCKLTAYQDQRGRWTIGYGQTGPGITAGVTWTQQQADNAIQGTIGALVPRIVGPQGCVRVPLNDNQLAALTSFAYNEGIQSLRKSQLLKWVNLQEWQKAADQFSRWIYIGNFKSPGLVNRRDAEMKLFLAPVAPGTAPVTVTG